MEILIAEDDAVSRTILEAYLRRWGYEVQIAKDGTEAFEILNRESHPELAILDWMMPGMDGIELCRRVRASHFTQPTHIILLTARTSKADIVEGLGAGADDFVAKPFDREELRARVQVGARIIELERKLAERVQDLTEALRQVKRLQGLLPICSYCKKVRNDGNYWEQVESYISKHSEAQFSHGICPDCYENIVKPELEKTPTHGKPEI